MALSFYPTNELLDATSYYMFDIWREHADPKIINMPLMRYGPWYFCSIALSFVVLIKVVLTNYMADRKPLELKPYLIFFNGLLFGGYGAFFMAACVFTKFGSEGFNCRAADPNSNDLIDVIIRLMGYVYIIGKCGDFITPIFRVLLKKPFSDMHVAHTLFMVLISYLGLVYYPGGVFLFMPFLDALYYSMLHGYLVMATPDGDQYRPSKKWPLFLARFRIAMFVASAAHGIFFYFQPNCGPDSLKLIQICYSLICTTMLTRNYLKRFTNDIENRITSFK